MNNIDWKQVFTSILEQNKENLYHMCKCCMERIEEAADTAIEGFRYFLTQIPLPSYRPDEIPETFFDIEESEINADTQKRIGEMEYQIIKELILNDVSEEVFYTEAWKRISDALLVSDIYQRTYFLLRMWLDARIPYYRLGLGVDMDNETYKGYVRQINPSCKKMLFAMNAGYPKRTQKASILLKIADELPEENERIVFWSLTIGRLENQILNLKKRVRELESQLGSDDTEIG